MKANQRRKAVHNRKSNFEQNHTEPEKLKRDVCKSSAVNLPDKVHREFQITCNQCGLIKVRLSQKSSNIPHTKSSLKY